MISGIRIRRQIERAVGLEGPILNGCANFMGPVWQYAGSDKPPLIVVSQQVESCKSGIDIESRYAKHMVMIP